LGDVLKRNLENNLSKTRSNSGIRCSVLIVHLTKEQQVFTAWQWMTTGRHRSPTMIQHWKSARANLSSLYYF